jgi:hypothetical protein
MQALPTLLRRWILTDDLFDFCLVRCPILLEQVIGFGLCRRFWIWIVEEILNTEENLLDGDSWLPSFFFVQDGKADGSGRIDVGMEKRWCEFAYTVTLLAFTALSNGQGA